jgi:tRNA A-37 threonylcarbamoyl transferase component Bud32
MTAHPAHRDDTGCPSADDLFAFAVGRLAADAREPIARHIETCAACLTRLNQLNEPNDPLLAELRDPIPTGLFSESKRADSLSPDAEPSPEAAGWPAVPGYEILRELGRGGMGVVYQARQLRLNRLVALKMVLAGAHARPEDLLRFLAEAEAVAQLQHPHIVQIYEASQHAGLPFFALEFLEGGSLAQKLQGSPLPAQEAAQLVERLARAMQAAHERGIIHRDLKPANVLLDQAGRPKITDFGLAKRVDAGTGLTRTGAIMGTPSYMAPEQAAGQGKEVGVAGDVYALGAILYELLTGRPPFKAATPLETVRQVLEEEPVSPRRLQPGLARDLETICLTCLHKEPGRRYPSALALAEDLRRYRQGEPITARPVGSVGRFARWCRRNPVVAGLTGAVAVSLMAGTTISTYFAIEARQRATIERAERERARAAEDDLEQALARSLVRPLDPGLVPLVDAVDAEGKVLSTPEIEALWELAGTANERLRRRFLEEALRNESTSKQLGNRAEWFVHAAVGMDRRRRTWAEQLFTEGMKDPNKSLRHRTEIAWVCLELAEWGSPIQQASTEVISQGWAAEKKPDLQANWRRILLQRFKRIAPNHAARLLIQALRTPGSTTQENDSADCGQLAVGLAAVAGRLEPAEAAHVCTEAAQFLIQKLGQKQTSYARRHLAEGLAEVTAWMEPGEATRLLMQALGQENGSAQCGQLAVGLATVARRLEPAGAARACTEAARLLIQALKEEQNADACPELARGLAAVAGRLERAEAARVCAEAARLLLQALARSQNWYARGYLAVGLAWVTEWLEPAEATRFLMQALAEEREYYFFRRLAALQEKIEARDLAIQEQYYYVCSRWAQGSAAVAWRLKRAEVAPVCAEAAQEFLQALGQKQTSLARMNLANSLVSVTEWLEPAEATRFLLQALRQEKDGVARLELAKGLAAVAGSLEPAAAARLCAETARLYLKGRDLEPDGHTNWELYLLPRFIQFLDDEVAMPTARILVRRMVSDRKSRDTLNLLLTAATRPQLRRRVLAMAGAVGTSANGPLASLPFVSSGAEPLPCRFTTQELVDLLKMPTCAGEVRRALLDHLGNRYHRRFDTHWDFVRYDQEQGLNLDFTTPPQRPDPKPPPLFQD